MTEKGSMKHVERKLDMNRLQSRTMTHRNLPLKPDDYRSTLEKIWFSNIVFFFFFFFFFLIFCFVFLELFYLVFKKTGGCFVPEDEKSLPKVINRSEDLETFGHTLNQVLCFYF